VLINNLINNAWKYTGKAENPTIIFSAEKNEDEIIYFVKNNGTGFDENFASNLFEPFQRLHSAKEFEGTGVGLSTVKRVTKQHHGRI
jgi:light-regulated signal transduction histidine kinase (bacteriophytochrome)